MRVVPFIEVVGDLLRCGALTISGSSATLAVSRSFAPENVKRNCLFDLLISATV
jgi:hypothetical protein